MSTKYFWLKLTNDFFEKEEVKLIRKMENGAEYINFYLQLLLKSLDNEGQLLFKDITPYSSAMLATLTDTKIEIVDNALNVFTEFHLISIAKNGLITMNDINSMLGSESKWAKKKREYRSSKGCQPESDDSHIEQRGHCPPNVLAMSSNCPIERELELELDNNIINNNIINTRAPARARENSQKIDNLSIKKWFENDFWPLYPLKKNKTKAFSRILALKPTLDLQDKIINALRLQITERELKVKHEEWCPDWKYPSTWVNNKCWNDEVIIDESKFKRKKQPGKQSLAAKLQQRREENN